MDSIVSKIKDRLSIVEVISPYLKIEKAGKNYKAKCPFHNEKTPSFSISPERGIYYCFGCGAKGDIFSFVEHFEGTNFIGALKILAEKAGLEIPHYQNKNKDKTEIFYDIMEEATVLYQKTLTNQKEVRSYLSGRGLNDDMIESFRIGYAPESWNFIFDYLIKKGYQKEDIEKVGLIKAKENRFYDRFRGRIMFPICDTSGRVIAFSGRIFELFPPVGLVGSTSRTGGSGSIVQAKYLNSPETPLFNKSNVLFGLDKAKSSIRTRDYSIIVEGQLDLILSHQIGFSNTVAVLGTAFNDSGDNDQIKINNFGLIRRLSPNIIFAYDSDEAGIRAVNRSVSIALSLDMQVKVAVLPKSKDPADIILESSQKWKEIVKNSTNVISFHLDKICNDYQDIRSRGKKIREIIFPFLVMVNSSIERSAYIKEIYSKTGIMEESIINDFHNYEKIEKINKINNNKKEEKKEKDNRRHNLEKKLFGIIFWQTKKKEELLRINDLITSFEAEIGSSKFKEMLDFYRPFADDLSLEAEMWYLDKEDNLILDTKELILNLKEEILQEEKFLLFNKINEKEKNKDKDDIEVDIVNYQKIVEKIEEIKNNRSE